MPFPAGSITPLQALVASLRHGATVPPATAKAAVARGGPQAWTIGVAVAGMAALGAAAWFLVRRYS